MTSWRKDTPITVARDILLQEHSCPAQTVAPRPGGSPSWAASRGCGALAAGGRGGLPSILPQASPATALAPAPGPLGLQPSSPPSLLCPAFWAVYRHIINCPKLSGLKRYLFAHGLAVWAGFDRDKSLWGPRNHPESPGRPWQGRWTHL